MQKRNINKYIRQIKRLYKGNHKAKKLFIKELEDSLLCYCEEHETATYSDLLLEFGDPADIKNFLSFHTAKHLKKRNMFVYWLCIIAVSAILFFAVLFTIHHVTTMLDYSNGFYVEYFEEDKSIPKEENPIDKQPDPTPITHIEFN